MDELERQLRDAEDEIFALRLSATSGGGRPSTLERIYRVLRARLNAAEVVCKEADEIEHDSWCGHGGTGSCDCNRSGLSHALVDWRKHIGAGG